MIEYCISAGEGTLIAHGIDDGVRFKTDGVVVICQSKDVPGAFAVVIENSDAVIRFRECGPDCETGK